MTSVIIRRQASGAMSRLDSAIVPIASWIIGMSVSSMSLRTAPASLARWRTWAASGAISERAASRSLGAARAAEDELLQPAILALQLLRAHEEADEGLPRIGVVGRGAGDVGDLLDARLEQRVDELLLVGEAAVDGAHPHAGLARDVVVRAAQPAIGEDHARRVQDALAVALRVAAERAL